jgi:hypothetical protein
MSGKVKVPDPDAC